MIVLTMSLANVEPAREGEQKDDQKVTKRRAKTAKRLTKRY
jgi:hypothetical protein